MRTVFVAACCALLSSQCDAAIKAVFTRRTDGEQIPVRFHLPAYTPHLGNVGSKLDPVPLAAPEYFEQCARLEVPMLGFDVEACREGMWNYEGLTPDGTRVVLTWTYGGIPWYSTNGIIGLYDLRDGDLWYASDTNAARAISGYAQVYYVLPGQLGSQAIFLESPRRDYITDGDFTLDGTVDAADAAYMFTRWGQNYNEDADIDSYPFPDGLVDAADAAILFANWTGDAAPSQVPEPSSMTLTLLGFCIWFRRRSLWL